MIIGLDLGTTNSLAAYFTEDGPQIIPNRLGKRLTPSVVTLAVTLQKAGGSKIEWKYPFGTEKEKIFLEFMDDILKVENQAQKDTKDGEKNNETGSTILHSVLYHLKEYEVLLKNAIKCGEKGTGICLDNMFEEHKSHAFFKGSRKMILDLIENYRDVDNVYEDIISILRLIHFFAEREE